MSFVGLVVGWDGEWLHGYKTGVEMGNMSYGAGFKYGDLRLDYTYTDHEDLRATHRISLTMAFGD